MLKNVVCFFLKYIYVLRFQPCIYSTVEQNSIPLCYGTAKCGHSDIALVKWSRWKCQRCGKLIFLRHQTFVYSPYKLHYHNYYFQIYLDVTTHHSNTVSCFYITKYSWLNLLVFFLLVAQYIFSLPVPKSSVILQRKPHRNSSNSQWNLCIIIQPNVWEPRKGTRRWGPANRINRYSTERSNRGPRKHGKKQCVWTSAKPKRKHRKSSHFNFLMCPWYFNTKCLLILYDYFPLLIRNFQMAQFHALQCWRLIWFKYCFNGWVFNVEGFYS